ncbi:Rha family transcriptional regulator [Niveispirillum cyanobacteriorum]|nr:Rha family transcriptional regulator [Niveispirillum cyanobacteriorum]GGE85565.1 hypothetical protein GCM10011317_48460 [Niveispirillum cyanobacteriorum]
MSGFDGSGKVPALTVRDGKVYANSRDVAAFFEKRHDHVLRDIDNLLKNMDSPKLGSSMFAQSAAPDGQGVDRRTFDMTRDGFALLAMGFTGEKALAFKLRYIEQFNVMEDRLRNPTPAQIDLRDPSQLSRIAIQLIELNRELEGRAKRLEESVSATKPKAAFYDQFANADGLYCLQNAGRVLGQKPNKFVSWLKQGYLFYQGSALVPKAQFRDLGLFEVKATLVDDKARHQTYVTPRGITYFAKKLGVAPPEDLFCPSEAAE